MALEARPGVDGWHCHGRGIQLRIKEAFLVVGSSLTSNRLAPEVGASVDCLRRIYVSDLGSPSMISDGNSESAVVLKRPYVLPL